MVRFSRALAAVLAVSGLVACASTAPGVEALRPQTGDLSFRLLWEGDADLDLHVREPAGRHVGFVQPYLPNEINSADGYIARLALQSETGVIDVDCNAVSDRHCPSPMENVFWPTGTAEEGSYEVWVELFRPPVDGSAVHFEVEIRRGERIERRLRGRLSSAREKSPPEPFEYQRRPSRR